MRIIVQKEATVTLRRASATGKINAITNPITTQQRSLIKGMIQKEAGDYQRALELEGVRMLADGEAQAANWRARLHSTQNRIKESGETLQQFLIDLPSPFRSVLYLIAFLSALATEYVFNAAALGYILSLRHGSLMAVAVAFCVAMTVLALDQPLHKLIVEPAEKEPCRRSLRIRATFLIGIGLINLITLGLLGEARAAGLLVQSSNSVEVQNASMIGALVLVITLVVALNGAVFFQVGRSEAARVWRFAVLRCRLARARREERFIGEGLRTAEAELVTLQKRAGDSEGFVAAAEHLMRDKEYDLASAEERVRLKQVSHHAIVNYLLLESAVGQSALPESWLPPVPSGLE